MIPRASGSGAILPTLMQSDVELVRGIIEALNRGDVDGMLARMHPDFEWRPLEASPVARVYRAVRKYGATSKTGSAPLRPCGSNLKTRRGSLIV